MAKQIKRQDISEEDLFKSVRDSAESTLKKINELNISLKESASVLKKDLAESNTQSAKDIEKLTQATNEAKKAKEAALKLDQEKIKVEQQLIKVNQELEKLEQQKLRTEREAIKNAQILEKEAQKAIKASQDESNVYKQKSALLNNLRNEYKNLAAQNKQNTAEAQALLTQVSALDKELKTIDATVGQHQRNVGNYSSALAGLDERMKTGNLTIREQSKLMKEYQQIALQAGTETAIGREAIKRAAELKDRLSDVNVRTKILSSDTLKLDTALAGLGFGASVFQGIQGAMALAGVENEKLMQAMVKLQAVQAVSNSLNQIATALNKDQLLGIQLRIGLEKMKTYFLGQDTKATIANTAATTAQAGATTAASAATRTLGIAMKALPIVAIVAGLIALAANWEKVSAALGLSSKRIKEFDEAQKAAIKGTADLRASISEMKIAFEGARQGVLSKEKALEQYNEKFGETLGFAKDLNEAEDLFSKKTAAFIQATTLRAQAQALLGKAAEESIKALAPDESEVFGTFDKIKTGLTAIFFGAREAGNSAAKTVNKNVDNIAKSTAKRSKIFTDEAERLLLEAMKIEKQYKINEDTHTKATKKKTQNLKMEIDLTKEITEAYENFGKVQRDIDKATRDIMATDTNEFIQIDEEDLLGIAEFEKAYKALEVQLLNSNKTKEEVDRELLEFEYEALKRRLEQKKAWGVEDLELEKQVAEKRRALLKNDEKTSKEMIVAINAVADAQKAASDKRIKLIDQEIAAAEKQFDYFQSLAADGNINARESLAEQQRLIVEANKQKEKEMRRQARIELAVSAYNAYQKNVEDKSVKNPLAKTITDITLLSQFIQNLPAFFDGTEDTGKNGQGVDGKGGFQAILHPNERVLTKEQNQMIGSLTNNELAKIAMEYNTGSLMRKGEGAMQIGGAWQTAAIVQKLDLLEKAIKTKPETNIELGEIVSGAMEIVKTTRKGNDVIYNRYRIK